MVPAQRTSSSPSRGLPRLPTPCVVCRQWAGGRVCEACRTRFAPPRTRCARCAVVVPAAAAVCADCQRAPPPFEAAVAALDYAFPWADVIGAFKFGHGLDRAGVLAALLADAVRAAALPAADLVLPVPLAPRRLAERGYNQAWELARRAARRLGVAADAALLRRLVETPPLADLPRADRAAAVRGAFGVDPKRAAALRGRRVALVDDVVTTTATAAEAARTLRRAGAAGVQLWTLARTPPPG